MKFNSIKKNEDQVTNSEGAKAYRLTPEVELYAAVVTAGLSDTFYENGDKRIERIRELMGRNNPEFTARLAVYARTEMYMRSVPLVLAVELAKQASGNNIVSRTVNNVVRRADEITELLAYYQAANNRTGIKKLNRLSKQLQKGLAHAFNRFDEYQFSKYDKDTVVTLRDALFLVHPKAIDEKQQGIFDKIATKTLSTPYTWETELSLLGQQKFENENERKAAFRAKWEELIDSGKLGYMALLRNMRNIIEANVSQGRMDKVCARLANEDEVACSKQLPFRFLAAWREIRELKADTVPMILNALEDAVVASVKNMKGFDSNTSVVVACDVSGSMQRAISPKSKVLNYDIGLMLGMLVQSKCKKVISGMFGDTWKIVNMPNRGVLANVQEYYKREGEVGYATNGYLVIEDLVKRKVVADKVMMFTDCQMWNSGGNSGSLEKAWKTYKKMAHGAKLYLFDLAGLGNTPVNVKDDDVYLVAGWSDKVFEVLNAIENGESAVEMIRGIKLD